MSDTNNASENHLAAEPGDTQELIDSLTFVGDVNEVFLLIDHISGRSDVSLNHMDTSGLELPANPPPVGGPSMSEVLHYLCQVGYPPHPDAVTKARKAAFILQLKDRLNALAWPARGITVAYTTMFVSATNGCSLVPWRRTRAGTAQPVLSDLARAAYPALAPHAACFARLFRRFPWLMLLMLALTASAYWDVGFGRTIVQRIEQLDKQQVELVAPDHAPATGDATVNDTICQAASGLTEVQIHTCGKLVHLERQLRDSRQDLSNFAAAASGAQDSGLIWRAAAWLRPVFYGFLLNGQTPPADRPEASVAWVLSLYSNYVLPAMFGFLGTLAATTRKVQRKVRDYVLGPRDLPLTVLGMFLGPIAGLVVGLFFTPTGTTPVGSAVLAGTVSLSASGLGFLAGYGAEAFFTYLDILLVSIFATDRSDRPAPASSPRR